MDSSAQVIIANLTSPPVLAFAIGLLAVLVKGDLRLPDPIYQGLSIYLLLGIGIKGGVALVQLDSGEIIEAKPINVSKAGERTRVSIRPERVEYNKERMRDGAFTLKAEVLEFIYMGDIFRTRLRVAGTDDFIIKTRNAPDQTRLTPGTQIEIGWLPEDCRALDA